MDWFQFIIFLIAIYAAYCLGHWTGYGKGEHDTKELTYEIQKLRSNSSVEIKSPSSPSIERSNY